MKNNNTYAKECAGENKYDINPEFSSLKNMTPPFSPLLYTIVNPLLKKAWPKPGKNTAVEKRMIPSYDGAEIAVYIITPMACRNKAHTGNNTSCLLPCLVYFHGGGFIIQAAPYNFALAIKYAELAHCTVVFADYRLTTHVQAPVPAEDCYACFTWVISHAEELGIDKKHTAVGGDSAGGALTAGVTLMARDRGAVMPCMQLLVYPVTDRRMTTDSMKKYHDTPVWNSRLSQKMWKRYFPSETSAHSEYESPMEAPSLAGLPAAYIETAEYDCLHDEGILYAQRLKSANVCVTLNETKGTVHGYDMMLEKSTIVQQSIQSRVDALTKAFAS